MSGTCILIIIAAVVVVICVAAFVRGAIQGPWD